jgi:probable phosphoglycerate mutase
MRNITLYYIRHGLTDWNIEGRLQGGRDTPLNDRGRAQAVQSAGILGDLLGRESRATDSVHYVSSPLVRASETMDIVRRTLALPPGGYAREPRLKEIEFGEWEGLTYLEIVQRDRAIVDAREARKWRFRPPGGETYEEVARRVGEWYATLTSDTVVTAHGGTARALVGHLGIALPDDAVHRPIEQGVVYVFAQRTLTRHA